MLKISKKASVNLSIIISALFYLALVFVGVIMPKVIFSMLVISNNIVAIPLSSNTEEIIVIALAYIILAFALLANTLCMLLLLQVKKENVFSKKCIGLIRGISWCAIAVGIFFAAMGIFVPLTFVVAVAALFLGLCVRVVKNVIEKATEIKSENDLTV